VHGFESSHWAAVVHTAIVTWSQVSVASLQLSAVSGSLSAQSLADPDLHEPEEQVSLTVHHNESSQLVPPGELL
jgi:hypothetical protein